MIKKKRRAAAGVLSLLMVSLVAGACRGLTATPASPLQTPPAMEPSPTLLFPTVRISTANAPAGIPATAAPPTDSGSPTPPPVSTSIETPSPTPLAGETPTAAPAYQAGFEPAGCEFRVQEGYNPECGFLTVPENRSKPDSALVRLHIAVFRSSNPEAAPDPVVYLAGGPGSPAFDEALPLLRQGLGTVLERRDLILFDQRGTGHSHPLLDCGPTTPLQRCRERLIEEGVDLSAYNSAATAADLNDLFTALGYERANLLGFSYGTRLALTMMRDYPYRVRSAVLDSVFPPQVHLYVEMAPNAQRAFDTLFKLCTSDPGCNSSYPNLEDTFYNLVRQLNEDSVTALFGSGGDVTGVKLDGNLLIDLVNAGLHNRSTAERIPHLIYSIQQGDYELLEEWLDEISGAEIAAVMQAAVQCSEEVPFSSIEEAYASAQGVQPQLAEQILSKVQFRYADCGAMGLPAPDPRENLAVSSDIPALLLAGELDPITPPEWGRLAASTLSNAYFFEFPATGHGVLRSTPCAIEMALAFWENPSAAPDSTCMQEIPPLQFRRRP